MERRQFLGLLGAAAAQWPLCANARGGGRPVIGFLNSTNSRGMAHHLAAFHRGLNATGFVEDHNVWFDYAWANGAYGQLPGLAGRLIQQGVDVIASSGGLVAAEAAVDAAGDTPVIFLAGLDPRATRWRQLSNVTGITTNTPDHVPERLEAFRKLVPGRTVALLVNPASTTTANIERFKVILSAPVLQASTVAQVEQAFREAGARGYAMLVSADPVYTANRDRLVVFEFKYNVPAGYPWNEYLAAGGFSAHGADLTAGYQTLGRYVGEVLKRHGFGRRRLGSSRRGNLPLVGAGAPDTATLPAAQLQLGVQRVNPNAARRHGLLVPAALRGEVRMYRSRG